MVNAPEIFISRDNQTWAITAAKLVQRLGQEAVQARGEFLLTLSGGRTPELLYQTLTSSGLIHEFVWSRTIFFFSDERCVSPDDPESNYALASRTLFAPLNISLSQIYRMVGESPDLDAAAFLYEQQLRYATKAIFPACPKFDLILLGLGADGHTASLFPGASVLHDSQRMIAITESPIDPRTRLTMTLGVLNCASVILFLVMGVEKARAVRAILDPKTGVEQQLPAALVQPTQGRLIWLLDQAAAAELPKELLSRAVHEG